MIRTIFFWIVFVGTILSGLLILPIISIFSRKEEIYHRYVVTAAKILLWIGGVKLRLSGLENIPRQGNVIFASNHQSLTDILAYLAFLPGYFRFVVMQQVYGVPIFGEYMKRAGYIKVDQADSRKAFLSMQKLISLLRQGDSILVFPEGTRSPDGNLQEFKHGVSMLILQANKAVVPMAISGSIKTMHKDEWSIHPGPVKVNIGKPMTFAELKEVNLENAKIVSAKLRETIEGLMHESLESGF